MALPTQLDANFPDDSNKSNPERVEAIPFAEMISEFVDEDSLELENLEGLGNLAEMSDKVQSGEIRPSWKDAAVPGNEEIIEQVAEIAYKSIGELTAEQVINTPYSEYKHLEETVSNIVQFVQKQLHDNDKLNDITEARVKRGEYRDKMVRYLDQMILSHMTRNPVARPEDTKTIIAMVINEILGLGPIEPLWNDPEISEIMINGPYSVKIERKGKMIKAKGVQFHSQEHLVEVCQQILGEIGRRIDVQHPLEDGRLRDGSRINVTHPAVGPGGPYVTIRRFPDTVFSMKKMVELKSMTEEMAVVLGNLIHAGCSAVIVGGTGTGKTSMLNALSGCISNDERIITLEDNLELRIHPDKEAIALEARPMASSGSGQITIRDLMKNTLRMRPDRIIVGEIRDESAYDMLQAMNTGHDGSLTTVHAEDATGAVERLRNLVDESGSFNASTALTLIAGGVDLFIIIERYEDGSRRVGGIYEVPRHIKHLDNGDIELVPIPLWEFVHDYTDENENVVGHYEKRNDVSDTLIQRKRLDKRKPLSLEEIYELSKVEEPNAVKKENP